MRASRAGLFIALSALMATGLAGCQDSFLEPDAHTFSGFVRSVNTASTQTSVWVFPKPAFDNDTAGSVVHIRSSVPLYMEREDGSRIRMLIKDYPIGTSVTVWVEDFELRSLPRQVYARQLLIRPYHDVLGGTAPNRSTEPRPK